MYACKHGELKKCFQCISPPSVSFLLASRITMSRSVGGLSAVLFLIVFVHLVELFVRSELSTYIGFLGWKIVRGHILGSARV